MWTETRRTIQPWNIIVHVSAYLLAPAPACCQCEAPGTTGGQAGRASFIDGDKSPCEAMDALQLTLSVSQVPLFQIGSTCAVGAARRHCHIKRSDMCTNTFIFITPNNSLAQPPHPCCFCPHLKVWMDCSFSFTLGSFVSNLHTVIQSYVQIQLVL